MPIALPLGTVFENSSLVVTLKPAFSSRVVASDALNPATSGTATIAGPELTLSVTVEPSSALPPPRSVGIGSCSTTWFRVAPLGTALIATSKPLPSRIWVAASTSCPITSGTETCDGRVSANATSAATPAASRARMIQRQRRRRRSRSHCSCSS